MKRDLLRYIKIGSPIDLIYIDSKNQISKRKVKLICIQDELVNVYCYTCKAPRSFRISNILAVSPVQKRKAV